MPQLIGHRVKLEVAGVGQGQAGATPVSEGERVPSLSDPNGMEEKSTGAETRQGLYSRDFGEGKANATR